MLRTSEVSCLFFPWNYTPSEIQPETAMGHSWRIGFAATSRAFPAPVPGGSDPTLSPQQKSQACPRSLLGWRAAGAQDGLRSSHTRGNGKLGVPPAVGIYDGICLAGRLNPNSPELLFCLLKEIASVPEYVTRITNAPNWCKPTGDLGCLTILWEAIGPIPAARRADPEVEIRCLIRRPCCRLPLGRGFF